LSDLNNEEFIESHLASADYLHTNNSELLGSFPWRLALVFVLSGAILIVVSIRSVEKRDF
jgi:hypothetical protein